MKMNAKRKWTEFETKHKTNRSSTSFSKLCSHDDCNPFAVGHAFNAVSSRSSRGVWTKQIGVTMGGCGACGPRHDSPKDDGVWGAPVRTTLYRIFWWDYGFISSGKSIYWIGVPRHGFWCSSTLGIKRNLVKAVVWLPPSRKKYLKA